MFTVFYSLFKERKTENKEQKTENKEQKTKNRKQKTKNGKQKTENKEQKEYAHNSPILISRRLQQSRSGI